MSELGLTCDMVTIPVIHCDQKQPNGRNGTFTLTPVKNRGVEKNKYRVDIISDLYMSLLQMHCIARLLYEILIAERRQSILDGVNSDREIELLLAYLRRTIKVPLTASIQKHYCALQPVDNAIRTMIPGSVFQQLGDVFRTECENEGHDVIQFFNYVEQNIHKWIDHLRELCFFMREHYETSDGISPLSLAKRNGYMTMRSGHTDEGWSKIAYNTASIGDGVTSHPKEIYYANQIEHDVHTVVLIPKHVHAVAPGDLVSL